MRSFTYLMYAVLTVALMAAVLFASVTPVPVAHAAVGDLKEDDLSVEERQYLYTQWTAEYKAVSRMLKTHMDADARYEELGVTLDTAAAIQRDLNIKELADNERDKMYTPQRVRDRFDSIVDVPEV